MDPKWKPQPKIVATAVATLVIWVVGTLTGADIPIGVEGAIAVVAGYLMPA